MYLPRAKVLWYEKLYKSSPYALFLSASLLELKANDEEFAHIEEKVEVIIALSLLMPKGFDYILDVYKSVL